MSSFTKEEIENLSDEELHILAGYLGVKVRQSMKRATLIERLLVELNPKIDTEEGQESPMSVRVARIKKSLEES